MSDKEINSYRVFPPDPDPPEKPREPIRYSVFAINDPITPMEFAKSIYQKYFRVTDTDSVFRELHEKGNSILGVFYSDIAETLVRRALYDSLMACYPMQFRIIPEGKELEGYDHI